MDEWSSMAGARLVVDLLLKDYQSEGKIIAIELNAKLSSGLKTNICQLTCPAILS